MNDESSIKIENNITLVQIFLVFLKMGFTAFGPAMMAETKKNIVKKLKWIDEKEFLEGLALAQLLPGATFVSLSIYIGYKLKGLTGAAASFVGFILAPSFIIVVLSWLYFEYENLTFINVFFQGLGAVVVALILDAVWDLAKTTTTNLKTIIIAIIAFIISILYNNIFLILFISASMGMVLIHKKIDNDEKDNIPLENYKIKWKDIIIVCTIVLLFFILTALNKELLIMTGVFFKIGALVFGNGFTMLPLIQHEVVKIHNWLNLDQFMVGVALGQMTPGPVSITATFIGYKVMGIIGAVVATLAIFMPSFLLVVSTFGIYTKIKNNIWVNSALKGLLASFVGLMTLVVINTGRYALTDTHTIITFVLSFIIMRLTKLDSKWIILGGTGIYLLIYYLR